MNNKKAINIIKTKENNKKQNILVVKVGNENRPASPEDIQSIQEAMARNAGKKNLTLITHLPIEFEQVIRYNKGSKNDKEILIVCVGTDERPAGPEDIQETQKALNQVALDPNLTYVTHHAVAFKTIKKSLLDNIEVVGVCQPHDYMKKQFEEYIKGVDSNKE